LEVRVAIATLVLGAALAAAPLASASFLPPGGEWKVVRVVSPVTTVKPLKLVRSCNAQSKARTAVARASRRTHPVACEQPPRSKALDGSFVITFGP
jgi:hypothetical protein